MFIVYALLITLGMQFNFQVHLTDLLSSSDWHLAGEIRKSMPSSSTMVPALCIAAPMLAI